MKENRREGKTTSSKQKMKCTAKDCFSTHFRINETRKGPFRDMKKKITYNLNNGLINPRYVGLVRASTPKNYEIEEYDEVPKHVININSCFSSSVNLHKDMELIDCVSEDDIFTIDFSKLNLDERTMLYFFFCVQCEKDTDVVFTIESHAIQRLWINCEMVCLCGRGKRQIHTLHLFAGNNVFCFQQHDSIELIKTTFRIKSLEIDQNDEIPLTYGNLCYQKGLIEIRTRYLDEFRFNGEDYHFLLYPIDCIHLLKGTVINMQIIDHISDTILYESDCYFYNLYTIKTSGFKYVNDNAFNYLDVKFSYFTIDGEPREVHTKIYLSQPENFINPVRDRTLKLLESDRTVEEKLYIEYVLSLNDKSQDVDAFHKWERIEKVISIIEQGEYYNYLRSEGEKVVCFHSDIDNTIDYYTVTLPRNYTSEHKYPLLIINNVLPGTWLSSLFSRAKSVEVIAVDFIGRGVTMGSYVGDAAFNEIYNDVFSRFSIDEKKVIMMGHSNGGYATWAQAELVPDRYSAIYPAVSEPNYDYLMNLSNMNVRYLTSESDSLNAKVTASLEETIKKHVVDYKTLWVEKFNHGLMGVIQLNEKIIQSLIDSASINKYPNRIDFYTDKNRYLSAYWISIHSIEFGYTFAEVHVEVNGNVINISAENTTGITLTIPPQVDKLNGVIRINDKCFDIDGNDKVIFHKNKSGFEFAFSENKGVIFKGTGVIDPFINPVRIISFLEGEYCDILDNFQTPSTNGFYGSAYVKYPILEIDNLSELPKYSFVILDNGTGDTPILDEIKSRIKIKMDKYGYSYLGQEYTGDYLILQVVEHPTDPDNSILYVNTNNGDLYRKCLFTRKIILPAYSNGRHPNLNSDAIIFDGKKYYTVFEYGLQITEY